MEERLETYEVDATNINTKEQLEMWLEYRKHGIEIIFMENKKAEHN